MQPVTISYNALNSQPETLRPEIVKAIGSGDGALGIIIVKDIPPAFHDLRRRLFHMAVVLATASDESKSKLERADTSYLFGWSHGKEVMNGKPDFQKGSFYANPLIDLPQVNDQLRAEHPEYYAGNVWPVDIPGLEDFEGVFKSLGEIIFKTGCLLARACETFVAENVDGAAVDSIEGLISRSQCNKARLLHYYPAEEDAQTTTQDAVCGTHLDHSLLTGLYVDARPSSAMYLTKDGVETKPPADSGLFIYPRSSIDAIKVSIPPDCLAFQTGEALELLTAGKLVATPHFVTGSAGPISRETLAFFLQPDVDAVIGSDGETFGAFTKRVLERHYKS